MERFSAAGVDAAGEGNSLTMARAIRITQAKLKEVIHYDPETGIFTWLVSPNWRIPAGSRAGTEDNGYRMIGIFLRQYREHQLAWLYVYGRVPPKIDHRDDNGLNNRITNLRECTKTQNEANKPMQKNNKSGLKGAYWYPRYGKWAACIGVNGKTKSLGYFTTAEQAHQAYCKAADELFGEFANYGRPKCVSEST